VIGHEWGLGATLGTPFVRAPGPCPPQPEARTDCPYYTACKMSMEKTIRLTKNLNCQKYDKLASISNLQQSRMRDGIGLDPIWRERWGVFFVEILPIDSIGEPLHRDRAIFQVGQNVTGNSRVVVDDLALGKATFRAHHLVEIGEANVSTRHT
jgi:hypothetical protein